MPFDSAVFFDRVKERLGSFTLIQIVFYTANGMFQPYRVVYLVERGIPDATIGFILTLGSLAAILAQPLWGYLCDRLRSIRKVFILCLTACTVLVPSLAFTTNVMAITVLLTVISVFICPFFPLLDTWTMQGIKSMGGNQSYGSFRMWGSIAFAPAMIIMGWIVRATSINSALITYGIFNILTITVAFCLPIEGVPNIDAAENDNKGKSANPVTLFKSYRFVTFIICYCLINVAAQAQLSFMPQRLTQAGGDTFFYGVLVAYGALCEVPMYRLSPWLMRKIKPAYMVMAGMLFTFIHMFALGFNMPMWFVILSQCFRGFAYSLYLVGSVYYVDSLSPDNLKASAQSITVTFSAGIAGMIGMGFGGVLVERAGILQMHMVGALFSAVSLTVFALTLFGGNLVKYIKKRR